jgi:hypothetical protein
VNHGKIIKVNAEPDILVIAVRNIRISWFINTDLRHQDLFMAKAVPFSKGRPAALLYPLYRHKVAINTKQFKNNAGPRSLLDVFTATASSRNGKDELLSVNEQKTYKV